MWRTDLDVFEEKLQEHEDNENAIEKEGVEIALKGAKKKKKKAMYSDSDDEDWDAGSKKKQKSKKAASKPSGPPSGGEFMELKREATATRKSRVKTEKNMDTSLDITTSSDHGFDEEKVFQDITDGVKAITVGDKHKAKPAKKAAAKKKAPAKKKKASKYSDDSEEDMSEDEWMGSDSEGGEASSPVKRPERTRRAPARKNYAELSDDDDDAFEDDDAFQLDEEKESDFEASPEMVREHRNSQMKLSVPLLQKNSLPLTQNKHANCVSNTHAVEKLATRLRSPIDDCIQHTHQKPKAKASKPKATKAVVKKEPAKKAPAKKKSPVKKAAAAVAKKAASKDDDSSDEEEMMSFADRMAAKLSELKSPATSAPSLYSVDKEKKEVFKIPENDEVEFNPTPVKKAPRKKAAAKGTKVGAKRSTISPMVANKAKSAFDLPASPAVIQPVKKQRKAPANGVKAISKQKEDLKKKDAPKKAALSKVHELTFVRQHRLE